MNLKRIMLCAGLATLLLAGAWGWGTSGAQAQEKAPEGVLKVHLSSERPQAGEELRLTMEASNPADNPELTGTITLLAPDGTTWTGRECDTKCATVLTIEPGTSRSASLGLKTSDPGPMTITGEVIWTTPGAEPSRAPLSVSLEAQPRPRKVTVELHANDTRIQEGGNLAAHLSVVNHHPADTLEVTMTIKPPEGTSVTATHNAESCAGECKTQYRAGPGEQKTMTVILASNDPGEFVLSGQAHWRYPATDSRPARSGKSSKHLVLEVMRPPRPKAEPAAAPEHREAESGEERFPKWIYAAILGGLAGLSLLVVLAVKMPLLIMDMIIGTPRIREHEKGKTRICIALAMIAGMTLAVTAVFQQTDEAGIGKIIMLTLPGVALIAGAGAAQRFLTPVFALLLALIACSWAGFYIGWSGIPGPGSALLNAGLITSLIAGISGMSILQLKRMKEQW